MKLKRIFSVALTIALMAALLVVPAFAADETLTLREDWRLTSDFDLNVPAGYTLTIGGQGKYHIYELGGRLLNSGGGTVAFMDGTILYPAAGDQDAEKITLDGIWDDNESNTLMTYRKAYKVTVAETEHGNVTVEKAVALPGDTVKFTITPSTGYQQDTVTATDGNGQSITVSNNAFAMPASDVTITVTFKALSGNAGSSGGGSSGSSSTTTETTKNPDGSTTTTVTNKTTGTVTETTKYPDGSSEVVETKKDGTVTTTSTDSDGNKTQTVENPDGTSETTVTNKDGSSSVTTVDGTGKTQAEVKLPAAVVEDAQGEAVTLPMPAVTATSDSAAAPTITVSLPGSSTSAKVEIPVANVTPGTVAVLVGEDGAETVIKTTVATENGVAVTLTDGETVKIVDNSKNFADVADNYWGADAVAFATSRELFNGTSSTTFSPNTPMTRSMIVTVLARLEGVDTDSGDTWYDAGRDWAMAAGISDGSNLDASLTREQLATMLYRYASEPAVSGTLTGYTDASAVSSYAAGAMAWAVENGIITGTTATILNPQGEATRAQVATMLMRFVTLTA